jgi:hypothetical protein
MKKILFICALLTLFVMGCSVDDSNIFYDESLSLDEENKKIQDVETVRVDLEKGSFVDMTRNNIENTARLEFNFIFLEDIDQNSEEFEFQAYFVCDIYQTIFYDEEIKKQSEEMLETMNLNKSEEEQKIDSFIEGYYLEIVKLIMKKDDGSPVFSCQFTGSDKTQGRLSLYTNDGAVYTRPMSDIY